MSLRLTEEPVPAATTLPPWQVLVVDDDPEVHAVTELSLRDFRYDGRPLELLNADSALAARRVLGATPDIALILLDVVMETEHAGLDLARYVREELRNNAVRIVLRTGQPGQAPPLEVVGRYQIDDYRTKTELTFERLHVLVTAALRTYRLVRQLELRNEALAQHASELERFTYVASHDMQTPLHNIVRLTQLLQRRLADTLGQGERELMDLVIDSTRDLQHLIDDLLTLARVGRGDLRIGSVDLNQTVRRVAEQLKGLMDERGVQLDYRDLPTVPGNAVLLEQMLRNLIENAIKFQPGAQPQVRIMAAAMAEGWQLRVSDRGLGIASEHIERVFEPFHRLHTRDQIPGSGVGLAICQRVARLHGGDIRAESVLGQGTTMVVYLPRTPPSGGR